MAWNFAHALLLFAFLCGGNVLEEFLDQVDVGEDHAAAAVTLETYFVEGLAVW